MIKYLVIMLNNKKHLFFLLSFFLSIFLFSFVSVDEVFASPSITSFLLNDSSQNITFNPNNGESISIEIKANTPVKFTRLYICSINQICNGTSGNYIRYFTQNDISDSISKTWNGKRTGDIEIVPEGEYKVMVSMTEGSNTSVTEFGQYSIFVNFSNANSATTNSTSSSSINDNFTPIATVNFSTHSNPEELSGYNDVNIFEITAGRERMTSVGTPLEFDAKYSLFQKDQCTPYFKWSFGDGFEVMGKNTEHTYKYSGEYQVVLNGNCGDYDSISRTTVKVVLPNVSISNLMNGDIEITNNDQIEINIGNWKIIPVFKVGGSTELSEKKDFIFPQDTIIGANKKIILSKNDLGYSFLTERISLNNPSGKEVVFIDIKILPETTDTFSQTVSVNDSYMSVAEAEKLLSEYKTKLALNNQQINKNEEIKETDKTRSVGDNLSNNDYIDQTASIANFVKSSSTVSFWSKLIDIPVKNLKSVARTFYDF